MAVPTVAQAQTDPGDEVPDDPGSEVPDDPGEQAPDDPGDEVPDDPGSEVPDDPGDEVPDEPTGEAPKETPAVQRGVYFREDFEDLESWTPVELKGDDQDQPLWRVQPMGANGSQAAVLATEQGLPRGLHQGLVSDTIDLSPVPHSPQEETQTSTALAAAPDERDVDRVFRGSLAQAEGGHNVESATEEIRNKPVFTMGPITLPDGPATFSIAHSFAFDDTRNFEDEAVSGLTIEARSGDGEWVPLEPTMVTRPIHDADAPGPRSESESITDGLAPDSVNACDAFRLLSNLAETLHESFNVQDRPPGCEEGRLGVPSLPTLGGTMLTAGDTTYQVSTAHGAAGNESTPSYPNAYIEPLDARGFTGNTDTDDDPEPDVIHQMFDLSPFSGEQVQLRLRAGTSELTQVPDGFWAIDDVMVEAAAKTNDLRAQLSAPARDHAAVPGEPFPVEVDVQNVGLVEQQAPFNVTVSVMRDGVAKCEDTLQAPADSLAFLETTTVRLDCIALQGKPYQVQAQLEPGNPDQDPRNDVASGLLPVERDEGVSIDVRPGESTVEAESLANVSVIVESTGNVRVDDNVTLTAFPYDSATDQPIGEGVIPFGTEEIHLPPAAERHPTGMEDARASATFSQTLPEGPYLLVAQLNETTAKAPIGAGTPPPPLFQESFESFDPGKDSFTFETGDAEWTVKPDSDVRSVPPVVDPGSTDGTAWAPFDHDASVVRPHNREMIFEGEVGAANPDQCIEVVFIDPCEQADLYEAGSPVVLSSPQGTQRVHAMAHDVVLEDAEEAQLEFSSSLIPPRGDGELGEARIYVATQQDEQRLADQLTDSENCPEQSEIRERCLLVNRQAQLTAKNAEVILDSTFALERTVRCHLVEDRLGSGVNDTTGDVTCPPRSQNPSNESGSGDRVGEAGVSLGGKVADETAQYSALAPALSGELVYRDATPHTWERNTIDLTPWAGENVTIGIVYISDSETANAQYSSNYHASTEVPVFSPGDQLSDLFVDPLFSGTIGIAPPEEPQGRYLVDRIAVETDRGLALDPAKVSRQAADIPRLVQDNRPGRANSGWQTVGYTFLQDLGEKDKPLRASAQLLNGDGDPVAEGADTSEGVLLGDREGTETGVRLFPRELFSYSNSNRASPQNVSSPANDPAVTVLASPTIDLRGTDDPTLRFDQKFDLSRDDRSQALVDGPGTAEIREALNLNKSAASSCQVRSPIRLDDLACLLDAARNEDEDLDVQNEVPGTTPVTNPPLDAGLFVRAKPVDSEGPKKVVEPRSGYRFPIGDAGAFEPTLSYQVADADAFPPANVGYRGMIAAQSPEPSTYTRTPSTLFEGTPVWAGHSDVDGDDRADWVTSELDLSEFAGQKVKLEFVLVGRYGGTDRAGEDDTVLTDEPWAIDGIEVVESDVSGEVSVEELRWPNQQLPRATEGEDLPVRVTASTPTGLDAPVHAKALLVDGDGCLRGETSTVAEYTTESGRPVPMPAGAELEMPTMTFEGEEVTGAPPWKVITGVDVDREPDMLPPSSIDVNEEEGIGEPHPVTGARNITGDFSMEYFLNDPSCQFEGQVTTAVSNGFRPNVEQDEFSEDRLVVQNGSRQDGSVYVEETSSGHQRLIDDQPILAFLSQGDGSDAGVQTELLYRHSGNHSVGTEVVEQTVRVETPRDRSPLGSPIPLEIEPLRDLETAFLHKVDLSASSPSPSTVWNGELSAFEPRTISVELSEPGPKAFVLTGEDAEGHAALGGTAIVGIAADGAGDPTQLDNGAEIKVGSGERRDLSVLDVSVDPPIGLSTEDRRIEALVQNTGTTTLEDVSVRFLANGEPIPGEDKTATLSAGEKRTFAVGSWTPIGDPSVVIKAIANAEGQRATGSAPLRSLIELGSLSPTGADEAEGWSTQGKTAKFQDPETDLAPRDTVSSIKLDGADTVGLADLAVSLDHEMDMEDRFDGGQVLLKNDTREDVLSAGPAMKEMGPYSPIGGKALTGERASPNDRVELDTDKLFGDLVEQMNLKDVNGLEVLGHPVLSDNPSANIEEDADEEAWADCAGATFADQRVPDRFEGSRCEWSNPTLPVPEPAVSKGIWYFQPGALLSDQDTWTVDTKKGSSSVEVPQVDQHLMLEAGDNIVKAAQEEGELFVSFDEARELRPFSTTSSSAFSVQVCALFLDYEDDRKKIESTHRCSDLRHGKDQAIELDWSETTLAITNLPNLGEREYDTVRLVFSMRIDRDEFLGSGLMGDGENKLGSVALQRPFKGWFVGPVTAEAGSETVTWSPSENAIQETDPRTGVDVGSIPSTTLVRQTDVAEQSTLVDVRAEIDGNRWSSVGGGGWTQIGDLADPPAMTVTSCQWDQAQGGECAWTDIVDKHYIDPPSHDTALTATAPYAMGLACTLPGLDGDGYNITPSDVKGAECPNAGPEHGTGVQVLSSSNLDDGDSHDCSDQQVGHPALWRTTCLHADRVDEKGNHAEDGTNLRLGTKEHQSAPPMNARGYGVDYRIVEPVDLRFATGEAWVEPRLEELGAAGEGQNTDLDVLVRAQARVEGEEEWTDIPRCLSIGSDDCQAGTWANWPSTKYKAFDLSQFIGQRAELAIRVMHPHPTLDNDEGTLRFDGLRLEAGYLRMVNLDVAMRAWTDTSIEGEGWTANDVQIFGVPIGENLGIQGIDSRALQGPEELRVSVERLHVHTGPRSSDGLFMKAPMNVTVYNQGPNAREIGLEGALRFDGSDGLVYSPEEGETNEWTANTPSEDDTPEDEGTCRVHLEHRGDEDIGSIEIKPRSSTTIPVRAHLVPEGLDSADLTADNTDLYPEDWEQGDGPPIELQYCYPGASPQLEVNVTGVREEDYVSSDDSSVVTAALDPFDAFGKTFHKDGREPGLEIGELTVEPTRPAEGEPVRIQANVSLVDNRPRSAAQMSLELLDPSNHTTLRELSGTDADNPVLRFDPYETETINWTISEPPSGTSLVRLSIDVQNQDADEDEDLFITKTEHAWMVQGELDDQVKVWDQYVNDFGCDHSDDEEEMCYYQDGGQDFDGHAQSEYHGSGSSTPVPFVDTSNDGFLPSVFINTQDDDNEGHQAIYATEWTRLNQTPPPVLALEGRWKFQDDQAAQNTGFVVQVCDTKRDLANHCDPEAGASRQAGWGWRTLDVLRAPEGTEQTLGFADSVDTPSNCGGTVPLPQTTGPLGGLGGGGGPDECTSAAGDWANLRGGEDMISGQSPGWTFDEDEEGAWNTVLFSGTEYSRSYDEFSPLSWEEGDNQRYIRYRVIAFSDQSSGSHAQLTFRGFSAAPSGLSISPREDTGGFSIPEEAPKAVPLETEILGEVGAQTETETNPPPGWDAEIAGLPRTGAVEAFTEPELRVTAPISPSGVSQSATLTPKLEVASDPYRSVETVVPVDVRAGQHPDLVVEEIKLPDEIVKDEEALVEVTVKNDGFSVSEATELQGVARFDEGGVDLLEPPRDAEKVTVPELPPGATETVVFNWDPSRSGDATVRVGADLTESEPLAGPIVETWDGGQIPETLECEDDGCNNVGQRVTEVRPPQVVDTKVDVDVLAQKPLVVGEPVDVRITVENGGPAVLPAFEVRLLAGVVSLLEEDPLRVEQRLEPGETWATTVELIPGFGGKLNLVGRATADESLVREARGLEPDGSLAEDDNTQSMQIPVVAKGLSLDAPRVVEGDSIPTNDSVRVPVTLQNLGSDSLDVSLAARSEQGIGTLVDDNGDPIGSVTVDPGDRVEAELLVLYDELPDAGRQTVHVDAVSEAGVERTSIEVDVPRVEELRARPVIDDVRTGRVDVPVHVTSEGNAPVQAQVSLDAENLTQPAETVRVPADGTRQVNLTAWLRETPDDIIKGKVTVRSPAGETTAPVRLSVKQDALVSVRSAGITSGATQEAFADLVNVGDDSARLNVSLHQHGTELGQQQMTLAAGERSNLTFERTPEPGVAQLHVEDVGTGETFIRQVRVDEYRPDVKVLDVRMDPTQPDSGETVRVSAVLANEGDTGAEIQPGLFVDGVLERTLAEPIALEPDDVKEVTFTWTSEEGDHTLTVSADPQERMNDRSSEDDAMAREAVVQAGEATGPVRGVPMLSSAWTVIFTLAATVLLARRDRSE